MTEALEGGEWSAARPGRTLPPGKTRYPFYRRMGGPQGQSGRAENLVPTGIRSWTVQPVVSRYTDWATRPTILRLSWKIYQLRPTLAAHLLVETYFARWCYCGGAVSIFLSPILVLTLNGRFLKCATITFSNRYALSLWFSNLSVRIICCYIPELPYNLSRSFCKLRARIAQPV